MQQSGSGSWQLRRRVDQHQHLALFVRDSLRLIGEDGLTDQVPPRLIGDVPDKGSLVSDADRVRTTDVWKSWWTAILAAPTVTAEMVERGEIPVVAQPTDTALGEAVQEIRSEFDNWFALARFPVSDPRLEERRRLSAAKRAAETVAARNGVPLAAIRAELSLLLVEGRWWHVVAPGYAVYSPDVEDEDDAFHELLCEAYQSGVS